MESKVSRWAFERSRPRGERYACHSVSVSSSAGVVYGSQGGPCDPTAKMMLEELQRRNYSQTTVKGYLRVVEAFARYFHRSPDQLGPEQIRAYQVYLFKDRKLNAHTVGQHTAALRFFYCKTLKRQYPIEEVPYPKAPRHLPIILTREEAIRLIDSAQQSVSSRSVDDRFFNRHAQS